MQAIAGSGLAHKRCEITIVAGRLLKVIKARAEQSLKQERKSSTSHAEKAKLSLIFLTGNIKYISILPPIAGLSSLIGSHSLPFSFKKNRRQNTNPKRAYVESSYQYTPEALHLCP